MYRLYFSNVVTFNYIIKMYSDVFIFNVFVSVCVGSMCQGVSLIEKSHSNMYNI